MADYGRGTFGESRLVLYCDRRSSIFTPPIKPATCTVAPRWFGVRNMFFIDVIYFRDIIEVGDIHRHGDDVRHLRTRVVNNLLYCG
jgi:hypothetical protein